MTPMKFECKDKQPYDTKEDAMKAIASMVNESYGGIVELRTYKCKNCHKWHLTSKIK